ncbi:hypothetical protein ABPG72_019950 [Tetrahymena utriculariae]
MKKQDKIAISLSPKQRFQALFDAGITNPQTLYNRLKRKIKISKATVYNYHKIISEGGKLFERKQRVDCGVVKSISKPEKQKIIDHIATSTQTSSTKIKKQLKLKASTATIKRFLKDNEFEYSFVTQVPPLSQFQKNQRVVFCKLHSKDSMIDAVHLWGGISISGALNLEIFEENLNADLYIKILKKRLIKWKQQFKQNKKVILYQDKDPKHTAKAVTNFLQQNGIKWVEDWPPCSLDLNPVENVWNILKQKISSDFPQNKNELIKSIKKHWKSIKQDYCAKLLNSWNTRCTQYMEIENEGTKSKSHLISDDIKYAVVSYKKDGNSNKQIVRQIGENYGRNIHPSTITNLLNKYSNTGNVDNQWSHQGREKAMNQAQIDEMEALIDLILTQYHYMHKKKKLSRKPNCEPSPQEQFESNQVGDPQDQTYVQQNLETFSQNQPQQSFDELISDKIFEIKKKIQYVKKLFPELNLDTVQLTPEELFDQDDLRLFKSIKSMLSPSIPLELSRKVLEKDYPITQLLDDYNLQAALIEIQQQFQLALQDEQFYYPFCCFYTQLWFQDAIEYYIASNRLSIEKELLNIENFQQVFSRKFQIINQILNNNTFKLTKKETEYLKTKAYSMDKAYGNDKAVFNCIVMKVKQTIIDFNLSLRKNEDKIIDDINFIDLPLFNEINQNYQKNFNQEKNRLATILKQSLQLKLRRINNNYLTKSINIKRKSPHRHNLIKKLVEKNQFFIGKKIDQMMYQLIQEEDALIPPDQPVKKLNQIQQGVISLMQKEDDLDISAKEKYQLIKEKNNNTLQNHTSEQEVKLILEKKLLRIQMKQQGLLWGHSKSSKFQKKDIKQIILEGKQAKQKAEKKEENRKKFLEDYQKNIIEEKNLLEKSFTSQTTREKTSADEQQSSSEYEDQSLKGMIRRSIQNKEPLGFYIQKEDLFKLQRFITRKINQRLKFSLERQENETIEQIQKYLEEFNQTLHQLPVSIIQKLIDEKETRRQFVYNLMSRIDQIDFAKNEIYIEILKNLNLNKQDQQVQLEQINSKLEQKYINQVYNYLQQLQPMINNIQNQQNFIKLIKKRDKKTII